MKINKNTSKFIAVLLIIMLMSSIILPNFSYAVNNELEIKKISNPTAGQGQADGIEPGGNRQNSYAWAMASRGDYVYVGTNKNIIGGVASTIVNTLVASSNGQLTEDMAWGILNVATNNEIPRPTDTTGGEIFKCNINTGEITKIHTEQKANTAFRMAMEHDGNLYFASYSSDITDNNYIYKIDENDNVEIAFTSSNGASLRAACIYDNSLFFGGVDAREELAAGDEDCAKLAILKKDANDDTKWDRVADYKDFRAYAMDPAVKNTVTSPIWDICSYDGYIYATIPNSAGTVVYKGHPATGDEQANEYGWYWTEIIGKDNNVENLWYQEIYDANTSNPNYPNPKDSENNDVTYQSTLISACATPFVFKDKLYLMNFDNTIQAAMQMFSGALVAMTGQQIDLLQYLQPIYSTLNRHQILWVYDDATGNFNEVENFTTFMKDTCNEYLWRTEIYNDELYISTMDSAVLYNWGLKFTGDNFTTLTNEELDNAITAIDTLIPQIELLASSNPDIDELIQALETGKTFITEFKSVRSDNAKFNDFVVEHEEEIEKMEVLSVAVKENQQANAMLSEDLLKLCNNVQWQALKMYAYIVRMVENDTWGFDLLKTSDGENFEIVTDNGFGDKYNYGGRSMITTDAGLYLGTANPFYGAQIWRLSDGTYQPPEDDGTGEGTGSGNGQQTGVTKEEFDALKQQVQQVIQELENNNGNGQITKEEFDALKQRLQQLQQAIENLENNNGNGQITKEEFDILKQQLQQVVKDLEKINGNNQQTGVSKEEFDALKQQLEEVIKNQEKFEEEMQKLVEQIAGLKNSINSGNTSGGKVDPNDGTTATGKLPNAGKTQIIIAFAVVFVMVAVATVKHIKYRDIDKY